MKIQINTQNEISLRSHLESEGFSFPCGGKGVCGRCKIIAPSLTPSEKDKTFFTEAELKLGYRLACDKVVKGWLEIDCLLEKRQKEKIKYTDADAYVIFEDGRTVVGLCDGGEVLDEVILAPTPTSFRELRSVAQHETVELYEEHGLAKATTILIAGTPQKTTEATGIIEEYLTCNVLEARLFDMASEDVLLLPKPTALVGSDLLLEMLGREEGTFLIKDGYLAYLDETTLYVSRVMLDGLNPTFYVAAVGFYMLKFQPKKKLIVGNHAVYTLFKEMERERSQASKNASQVLASNRNKAKLERLAKKVVEVALFEEELFHEILNEITE